MHLKETKKQAKPQQNNESNIQPLALPSEKIGTSSMAETSSSMSVFADLGIPEDAVWDVPLEVSKRSGSMGCNILINIYRVFCPIY